MPKLIAPLLLGLLCCSCRPMAGQFSKHCKETERLIGREIQLEILEQLEQLKRSGRNLDTWVPPKAVRQLARENHIIVAPVDDDGKGGMGVRLYWRLDASRFASIELSTQEEVPFGPVLPPIQRQRIREGLTTSFMLPP